MRAAPDAPAHRVRLVGEHRDELGVLGELRMEPLDRDRAGEARRAEQPPEVNRRHPAGSYLVIEDVATDDSP